jgi:hypothetical protein
MGTVKITVFWYNVLCSVAEIGQHFKVLTISVISFDNAGSKYVWNVGFYQMYTVQRLSRQAIFRFVKLFIAVVRKGFG